MYMIFFLWFFHSSTSRNPKKILVPVPVTYLFQSFRFGFGPTLNINMFDNNIYENIKYL